MADELLSAELAPTDKLLCFVIAKGSIGRLPVASLGMGLTAPSRLMAPLFSLLTAPLHSLLIFMHPVHKF
jgi:hypothetical protein